MQKEANTKRKSSFEEQQPIKIGYIFCEKKLGKDELAFLRIAKQRNVDLIMFNISKYFDDNALKKRAKLCKVIFNNSAEDFAVEYTKMLEEMGKKVIDSSKAFYYTEDKWMFYLKCKKNNIPTPKTILLPENITIAKNRLKKFNHWPVILKRIAGTMGEYVAKADNMDEAVDIMEKFWKKGSDRIPIIAQQFIKSKSYRITLIDGEIVQTATKDNKGWKSTGVYQKEHHKFRVGSRLKKIAEKTALMSGIKVCGIDLMRKGTKWFVVEVNSQPSLDFFPDEREKLIEKVFDLLIKESLRFMDKHTLHNLIYLHRAHHK